METVRTYTQTNDIVDANPGITTLIADYHADAHDMITKGQLNSCQRAWLTR